MRIIVRRSSIVLSIAWSVLFMAWDSLAGFPERTHLTTTGKIRSFWIFKNRYLSHCPSEGRVYCSQDQLENLQALFHKGAFALGEYYFYSTFSASVNNHDYIRRVPHYSGGIWFDDMLYPLFILVSYDPLGKVLYISDDEYAEFENGLVVSNVPPSMLNYQELNKEFPRWMEHDVSALQHSVSGLSLGITITTFHPECRGGLPFYYLVPYLSSTFGTNVCLKSDTLVAAGLDFAFVASTNTLAEPRRTKHDMELTIGDTTLHVDDKRYLEESFFDELTNAMIRAVDQLRARP